MVMATFAAGATRGTVIDAFVTPELLQQVVRHLSDEQRSFKTHIVVSRRLGRRAGETTAPSAQRVRCLKQAPTLEARLDDNLAHAFRRAIGQMTPQARRASRRALSVF